MLCDICQTKQAKIFYTEIVNGQKKEQHLCEDCASEYTAVPLTEIMGGQQLPIGSILSGILSKYAKNSEEGESGEPARRVDSMCPGCGMTESEFLKMGRLGCPVCYNAFSNLIKKNFKTMQGGLQHTGKEPVHTRFIEISDDMPKTPVTLTPAADGVEEAAAVGNTGASIREKTGRRKKDTAKKEVTSFNEVETGIFADDSNTADALKKELQAALEIEDYEKAALLRDKIRELEKTKNISESQKNEDASETVKKTGSKTKKSAERTAAAEVKKKEKASPIKDKSVKNKRKDAE